MSMNFFLSYIMQDTFMLDIRILCAVLIMVLNLYLFVFLSICVSRQKKCLLWRQTDFTTSLYRSLDYTFQRHFQKMRSPIGFELQKHTTTIRFPHRWPILQVSIPSLRTDSSRHISSCQNQCMPMGHGATINLAIIVVVVVCLMERGTPPSRSLPPALLAGTHIGQTATWRPRRSVTT